MNEWKTFENNLRWTHRLFSFVTLFYSIVFVFFKWFFSLSVFPSILCQVQFAFVFFIYVSFFFSFLLSIIIFIIFTLIYILVLSTLGCLAIFFNEKCPMLLLFTIKINSHSMMINSRSKRKTNQEKTVKISIFIFQAEFLMKNYCYWRRI